MTDPTELVLAAIDEAFKAHVQGLWNTLHNAVVSADEVSAAIDRATAGYKMALTIRLAMQRVVMEEK